MEHLWVLSFFPITFIVPYVVTMKLLAFFSDWERLAKNYRYFDEFQGKIYYRQSARIKWTNYKGCLKIGLNDEGCYLAQL